MATKSKTTHTTRTNFRRREAERQRDEQRERAWRSFLEQVRPLVLLIWLGFACAIVAVLIWGSESLPWSLNEKVDRDITARVTFDVDDTVRTQEEQEAAKASAPDVFVRKLDTVQRLQGELSRLADLIEEHKGNPQKFQASLEGLGWTREGETLGDGAIKALESLVFESNEPTYDKMIEALVARLSAQYIVEPPSANRKTSPNKSILRDDVQEVEVASEQLVHVTKRQDLENTVRDVVADTPSVPEALREPLVTKIVNTMGGVPTVENPIRYPLWRYDWKLTEKEMEDAAARVEPVRITRNERTILVKAGTELSPAELELLEQEHQAFLEKERNDRTLRMRRMLQHTGIGTIVFVVVIGLALYVAYFQRRVFEKPARTLALCSLLFLMVLFSRLLERVSGEWNAPPEFAVCFVVIAGSLLTIAYNQRFALGACLALSILVTLASRGDFGLFLTLLVAMGITIFPLREVRTRSKLVGVGILAAIGVFLVSAATTLMEQQELKYVLVSAGSAALAAFLAGFIVQGLLHPFERIFGIATSMTLLEWCDASRQLLRRLAQEAPGTYSHSLVLSQMAEEASETIGANGLIARVGALYHDIGKIQKADYFVENQEARVNRHDRLSPTMSLLIIVGHVKDGVEMAKAYGLPRVLHQFIAEHHGTTVVKYFHHAASEAAAKSSKGRHDREVAESEFRYPGPKPRSKETAILMLCDGCEGAVRALSEPTSTRIESTVHQVFMDRLRDGQFDNCDITLRELHLVEQSLVKSLCAIHHGRIKYPKGDASKDGGKSRTDEDSKAEATAVDKSGEKQKDTDARKPAARQGKDDSSSRDGSGSRETVEVAQQT